MYDSSSYKLIWGFRIGLEGVMVFITTFNNISVKSWRSVLLLEKTELPRENHGPAASH
jgi:hypothetical protein